MKKQINKIVSKISVILTVSLISAFSSAQTTIWLEDFQDLTRGDESDAGATAWSVACTGGGSCGYLDASANDYFEVWDDGPWNGISSSHYFLGSDMDGEAKWSSEIIDISGYTDVGVSVFLAEYYFGSDPTVDYLKAYYSIDGGAETLLTNGNQTGNFGTATAASSGLSGSTIQIFIYVNCNSWYDYPAFDDVTVTGTLNSDTKEFTGTALSLTDNDVNDGSTYTFTQTVPTSTAGMDYDLSAGSSVTITLPNGDLSTASVGGASSFNGQPITAFTTQNATMLVFNVPTGGAVSAGSIFTIVIAGVTNHSSLGTYTTASLSAANDEGGTDYYNSYTYTLIGPTTYYSIDSDDWDDNSTWSTVSHSSGTNSGSYPVAGDIVYIEGHIITINNSSEACGQVLLNGASSNTELKVKNSSGSLTVSGNVTADNNGVNKKLKLKAESSSSLTVGGNVSFIRSGGNKEMKLEMKSAATVSIAGNLIMTSTAGTSKLNKIELKDNNSSLYIGGDVNLTSTGGKLIEFKIKSATTLTVLGDINFNATADELIQVCFENSPVLNMGGNFNRQNGYGELSYSSNSSPDLNLIGTAPQVIKQDAFGTGETFEYYNVTINNTFGTAPQVTLDGQVTVNGALVLTSGIVKTTSTNLLVIADGATSSQGSASSFVDGPMKKIGNDNNFVFPVGDETRWARLEMKNINNFNATTEFTCEYFHSATPSPTSLGAGVDHVSANEYWDLTRTVDPGDDAECNIKLYWESDVVSGISDMTDLALSHYSGVTSAWENHEGIATDNGDGTGNVVSTVVISNFSPSTFMSKGGTNVLPVELISFEAHLNIDKVELMWVTASEENNEFFSIERSQDGINFEEILQVEGAGESSNRIEYFDIDYEPLTGVSYYRLKQTDTDGKCRYSGIVPVDYTGTNQPGTNLFGDVEADIKIWPNPNDGTHLIIEMTGNEPAHEVLVILRDITGREFYSKVLITDMDGHLISAIDPTNTLPVGTYLITGSDQNHLYSKKLIVK